jgi:hypothetical protein
MRLRLPLSMPSRRPRGDGTANPRGVRSLICCCPLSHLLVVVANSLQLCAMVCFLVLLLLKLRGDVDYSWFAVMTPLWMSDAITFATGSHELRRICCSSTAAFA